MKIRENNSSIKQGTLQQCFRTWHKECKICVSPQDIVCHQNQHLGCPKSTSCMCFAFLWGSPSEKIMGCRFCVTSLVNLSRNPFWRNEASVNVELMKVRGASRQQSQLHPKNPVLREFLHAMREL